MLPTKSHTKKREIHEVEADMDWMRREEKNEMCFLNFRTSRTVVMMPLMVAHTRLLLLPQHPRLVYPNTGLRTGFSLPGITIFKTTKTPILKLLVRTLNEAN